MYIIPSSACDDNDSASVLGRSPSSTSAAPGPSQHAARHHPLRLPVHPATTDRRNEERDSSWLSPPKKYLCIFFVHLSPETEQEHQNIVKKGATAVDVPVVRFERVSDKVLRARIGGFRLFTSSSSISSLAASPLAAKQPAARQPPSHPSAKSIVAVGPMHRPCHSSFAHSGFSRSCAC